MGRRFITARDIDDLLARGEQELTVDDHTTLTDLAREHARDRGVRIVAAAAPRVAEGAVAERPPTATQAPAAPRRSDTVTNLPRDAAGEVSPAAAAQAGAQEEGVSRRQLRAAVRAAVIAELGTTPPGIDAAIGRVLDRFDVRG